VTTADVPATSPGRGGGSATDRPAGSPTGPDGVGGPVRAAVSPEPSGVVPTEAATGVQYSIAVHGPGYDQPLSSLAPGPARGFLNGPRVIAAAGPTVVLLSGPAFPAVTAVR
jgi:hypothetical protein